MNLRLIRFLAGMVIAIAIYLAGVEAYNRYLAAATEPLLHLDRRFASATVEPRGRKVVVSGGVPSADIPADQLSYNFILLTALFASNRSPLRDRNMRSFAISLLIVALTHPIGVLLSIESTYAANIPHWSVQHYGDFAANAWVLAELIYRVVGMFGIVFACWFVAPTRE